MPGPGDVFGCLGKGCVDRDCLFYASAGVGRPYDHKIRNVFKVIHWSLWWYDMVGNFSDLCCYLFVSGFGLHVKVVYVVCDQSSEV